MPVDKHVEEVDRQLEQQARRHGSLRLRQIISQQAADIHQLRVRVGLLQAPVIQLHIRLGHAAARWPFNTRMGGHDAQH